MMFRGVRMQRSCISFKRCYSQDLPKMVAEALNQKPKEDGFELIVDLKREGNSRTELAKARKISVTGKPVEDKILFNSFIEQNTERVGYIRMLKEEQERIISERRKLLESQVTSIVAQMMVSSESKELKQPEVTIDENENEDLTFPFQSFSPINESRPKTRRKLFETNMVADNRAELPEEWLADYGTADVSVPASDVPCSGCGANLHCKDSGVPGFIPSETFKVLTRRELYRHLCQRCFFLREHNMALKVSVSPQDYVKVISEIQNKMALVLLVVDILDFPSSIWPGLLDIIGRKRPVVLIGNKVDLVPLDGRGCLERMKKSLAESAQLAGLDKANLKHVALVSAKTGFGVEELITKLWSSWKNKGDIYILGCTNVGKSSLFNALLQSDLCKADASDLIDRATTSVWPGTTLNLLKFPLISPSAIKVYERTQRLISERRRRQAEMELQKEQLKNTQNPIYASLIGKIGRTFLSKRRRLELEAGSSDPFSVGSTSVPKPGDDRPIYNPNDPTDAKPRFCLDTPGTVHEDQILTLLTMKELDLVVPRELIAPRSFLIRPGMTFFLAGLGRIDFVEGNHYVIITVFSSSHLPVTILPTSEADNFYAECKSTPLIAVPAGTEERLKLWPEMVFKDFEMKGIWWEESYADITLSSAGWVAVTLGPRREAKLRVGTPEGRGIYLRKPPLLPKAVELRGPKIRASPAYRPHKLVFGH